jgi:hypothetical protein
VLALALALPLQIDENVRREIINHRSLRHPNIIRFKEVRQAAKLNENDSKFPTHSCLPPCLWFFFRSS